MMLRGLGDDAYTARIAADNAYMAAYAAANIPAAFPDVSTVPGGTVAEPALATAGIPIGAGNGAPAPQILPGIPNAVIVAPEVQILPGVPNAVTVLGGGAAIAALFGVL